MKILWLCAGTFRRRRRRRWCWRPPSLPLFIINFSDVARGGRDFVGWYFASGIPAGYCCKLRPLSYIIYIARRALCTTRLYIIRILNTYSCNILYIVLSLRYYIISNCIIYKIYNFSILLYARLDYILASSIRTYRYNYYLYIIHLFYLLCLRIIFHL